MGSQFYQVKIGLYILVIAMVGILFGVRVNNAWQKTIYARETIFRDGDIEISLNYPAKILSPKIDANYPLTLSFYYTGDTTSPHTYEISLQSPTLLFVDAKGVELTPHFQFISNQTFYEQSVYVRPYLSETYPERHVISVQVLVDGQAAQAQSAPIEIQTEAWWFSFFSLAAASLVEISVATALITWIVNAIDASSTARKERVAKIREALNSLSSLSYLEQMDKVRNLEDEVRDEHLADDVGEEVQRVKERFKEEEFFCALGENLRQNKDKALDVKTTLMLHCCFFQDSKHAKYFRNLVEILESDKVSKKEALFVISSLMQLWDEFDVSAKDFIVSTLNKISSKVTASINDGKLLRVAFNNDDRRRILRDIEIRTLFPQLVYLPPVGYDAKWLHLPPRPESPIPINNWLKQHALIYNPFGSVNLNNYPFYPEGFARPDDWEKTLEPVSQSIICPSDEDVVVLIGRLRRECLPRRQMEEGQLYSTIQSSEDERRKRPTKLGYEYKPIAGNQRRPEPKESSLSVFPVLISVEQILPTQWPLVSLAYAVAWAWLDVLPSSPDACLDLSMVEKRTLFDFLFWAVGSKMRLINMVETDDNETNEIILKGKDQLLYQISKFETSSSSINSIPADQVLLSWLKLKPPALNHTCLLLPVDAPIDDVSQHWFKRLASFLPSLFHNEVMVKTISSASIPISLPEIHLSWSDKRLSQSIDGFFDLAMDVDAMQRGIAVHFHELFGANVTQEETTKRLISESHNSLARMLNLGNRLLQYHCEHRTKDGVPEKYLYVEDLETILNTA